jgi:hypothetical protein
MPRREVYPPYEHQNPSSGCWISVMAIAGIGSTAAAVRPSFAWLAVLLSAPVALTIWHQVRVWQTTRRALAARRRGIRGLLVYSRSPNWQPYIEEHWLPRIAGAVEVVDWSDRARWRKNDHRVRVFETFIRSDEAYNPSAVVFRSTGAPLVFRFYPAFKNAKHGNVEGLKDLEAQFFAALEE